MTGALGVPLQGDRKLFQSDDEHQTPSIRRDTTTSTFGRLNITIINARCHGGEYNVESPEEVRGEDLVEIAEEDIIQY
jgi:hypothetical protein